MNMRLCFGTFIKILDLCKCNITQEDLIAEIIRIADDPNSRYIMSKEAISKLKNCKIDYVFYSGDCNNVPSANIITQKIHKTIAPYISEDKKATVVLMLLYIIQNESQNGNEKNEYFKKYFSESREQLLNHSEFPFSDFLCKVLLYTLYSNINNKIGEECVRIITHDFISEKISPYKGDYLWEASTETLTLSFRNAFFIFDEALDKYTVRQFISETDPMRGINEENIENCDNFYNFIYDYILAPFSEQTNGKMLEMIHDFAETLNDYIQYLSCNMLPQIDSPIVVPINNNNNFLGTKNMILDSNYMIVSSKNPTIFVPRHDAQHASWAKDFKTTTTNYRQQLIHIYENDIRNYLTFGLTK